MSESNTHVAWQFNVFLLTEDFASTRLKLRFNTLTSGHISYSSVGGACIVATFRLQSLTFIMFYQMPVLTNLKHSAKYLKYTLKYPEQYVTEDIITHIYEKAYRQQHGSQISFQS